MSGVAAGTESEATGVWRRARRLWRRPLWVHAACLAAMLVVIAPFLHLDETFTSDEGAYALQVAVLEDGHWEYAYEAEPQDPEGRWFPLVNSSRSERGWYPYVQHPSVPMLLLVSTRVLGRVAGLHAPGMLGALGAAVAAWLLAAEIAPALRRAAFWLVAVSPAAVNGYIIWAHAPMAAVAGFALVAAVRVARQEEGPNVLVLLLCLVAGVLLRSEGLLFAVAVSGALAVGCRRFSWRRWAAVPSLCLALVGLVAVAERSWISAIVGASYQPQGLRDRTAGDVAPSGGSFFDWALGRVQGAWHSVFQGPYEDPRGTVLVALALGLVAFAVWALRRQGSGWRRDAELALVGAVVVYAVRVLDSPSESMTGLFAAWPIALLGVGVVPLAVLKRAPVVTITVVAFTVLVLVTQYRVGGGLEWGGRFLSPLTAPLAVMTAVGVDRVWRKLPGRRVLPIVCALAVVPLVAGLVVLRSTREVSGRIVDEVTAGPRLVVTSSPALPRAAWRTYPDVAWMKVPPDELGEALAALRSGGVREVTVRTPSDADARAFDAFPRVRDVTDPDARQFGWRTLHLSAE